VSDARSSGAPGAELAGRIWGRYGGAPGVLSPAATFGLAGRATRLATRGLPLLDTLRRRWAVTEAFDAGARVPLRHAGRSRLEGAPLQSPAPPQPQTDRTPPSQTDLSPPPLATPALPRMTSPGMALPPTAQPPMNEPRRYGRSMAGSRQPDVVGAAPQAASGLGRRLDLAQVAAPGTRRRAGPDQVHPEGSTRAEHPPHPAGRHEDPPEAATGTTATTGSLPSRPLAGAAELAGVTGPPGWMTLGHSAVGSMIVHRRLWDVIGHTARLPPTTTEPARAWRGDAGKGRLPAPGPHAATTPTASVPLVARLLDRMPAARPQPLAMAPAATASTGPAGALAVGSSMLPAARPAGFGEERTVAPVLPRLEAPAPLTRSPQAPGTQGMETPAAAPPPSAGWRASGSQPVTGTESEPAVDLARLADQVYELLVRRLASERERRGL
jgi:hypothetical protein